MAAEVPEKNVAEIFRIYYLQLTQTLTSDDITATLYSGGLISVSEKEGIEVEGQSPKPKTAKLLHVAAVQRAINTEPNNTFLKVLNKHQKYKPLVKKIIMDHSEMFICFIGANDCTCYVIVLNIYLAMFHSVV